MRDEAQWKPAEVVAKSGKPRSYIVQTPAGVQYRRNRRDLAKSRVNSDESDEEIMSGNIEQKKEDVPPQSQKEKHSVVVTRSGRISKPPQYFAATP